MWHDHTHVSPVSRRSRPAVDAAFFSEYLDDASLALLMGSCSKWHRDASLGKWADAQWRRRCDAVVADARSDAEVKTRRETRVWLRRRGASGLVARRVLAGLEEEAGREHCCGRGKHLALIYAPSAQRRRFASSLERDVEEARAKWHSRRLPFLVRLETAKRRLRLVAAAAAVATAALLKAPDAALVAFWPARFVWHVSSIARLAHRPLADYAPRPTASKSDTTALAALFSAVRRAVALTRAQRSLAWRAAWPTAHALLAPEALELRRYAFLTSLVLFVASCGLLIVWWRVLFFALGAFCANVFGLHSLDVAACDVRLRLLEANSACARQLDDAVHAREVHAARLSEDGFFRFERKRRFENPFTGCPRAGATTAKPAADAAEREGGRGDGPGRDGSDDGRDGRRCAGSGRSLPLVVFLRDFLPFASNFRGSQTRTFRRRSILAEAAELNRPLLLLVCGCATTTLLALAVAVGLREDFGSAPLKVALRYSARAGWILARSVALDILPVLVVPLKLFWSFGRVVWWLFAS